MDEEAKAAPSETPQKEHISINGRPFFEGNQ